MSYHDDVGSNTEADAARHFFAMEDERPPRAKRLDPSDLREWCEHMDDAEQHSEPRTNGTAHPALTEQPFTEEEA